MNPSLHLERPPLTKRLFALFVLTPGKSLLRFPSVVVFDYLYSPVPIAEVNPTPYFGTLLPSAMFSHGFLFDIVFLLFSLNFIYGFVFYCSVIALDFSHVFLRDFSHYFSPFLISSVCGPALEVGLPPLASFSPPPPFFATSGDLNFVFLPFDDKFKQKAFPPSQLPRGCVEFVFPQSPWDSSRQ